MAASLESEDSSKSGRRDSLVATIDSFPHSVEFAAEGGSTNGRLDGFQTLHVGVSRHVAHSERWRKESRWTSAQATRKGRW